MTYYIFLALLAGAIFAVSGVAYRIGGMGKAEPIQCGVFLSVLGFLLFGFIGYREWQNIDGRLAVIIAIAGIFQYLVIVLLRWGLKLGPLSPVWCAASLNFIPTIIYAAIFCNEKLSIFQYFSIAATVGAIVSASFGNKTQEEQKSSSLLTKILYCIILLALVIFNSSLGIALKLCTHLTFPGSDITYNAGCGNVILSVVYFIIMACGAADLTVRKKWVFNKLSCTGGVLLGISSTTGYALLLYLVGRAPAVTVFALSSTVSILVVALISVAFMHEKINRAWFLTVGFSVLSILLNR